MLIFTLLNLAWGQSKYATNQLELDRSLQGAASCRPNDLPLEFLENYALCYQAYDMDACDSMYKFASVAQIKGVQKADQYIKSKAGKLSDRVRQAIVNDFGNSLHSEWQEDWKKRAESDPANQAGEAKNKAHYEAEGRTLVSGESKYPPRYKVDPSAPGKFFDIANLSFDKLPEAYAKENRVAAEQAIDAFFDTYKTDPNLIDFKDPVKLDKMSETFHQQWLERNRDLKYVTGDPELEAKIKDENGIPRKSPLPKKYVDEKVLANRTLIKKWEILNQPFRLLPEDVKNQNRNGVKKLSVMFENRYVNRMGKDVAYLRAGARSVGARTGVGKAITRWGAQRAIGAPIGAAMLIVDATPMGCAEFNSEVVSLDKDCKPLYKLQEKELGFLGRSPAEQDKILRSHPDICNYYKELGAKLMEQAAADGASTKLENLSCKSESNYVFDVGERGEKREYVMNHNGTKINKIIIQPLRAMNPPREYEVQYSEEGDIKILYRYNGNVLSEQTEGQLSGNKATRYFSTAQFHSPDMDQSNRAMADVFYTAKISQHTLTPVRRCCRKGIGMEPNLCLRSDKAAVSAGLGELIDIGNSTINTLKKAEDAAR